MSAQLWPSAARDQAWGRFYARNGARRALREASISPSNAERVARYYADLAGRGDFNAAAHTVRGARGLAIVNSMSIKEQA